MPFHKRLAELSYIEQSRELNEQEYDDLEICLKANMHFVRKIVNLYELSYLASATDDVGWQLEICGQIDELIEGKGLQS
ncbi:hypothetical protein AZF04_09840 [Alkalihalobacillus trypoxylicola]|uniref:Uncharacterized protein n=2 Tax=Alkalihalobacillus trypoxylicola TaxID=519424 RepID=A0A162D6E1_9BACI|nr:hypothetical protein AZF04_09840 [Alkalihalobacillus trypoxylicola]